MSNAETRSTVHAKLSGWGRTSLSECELWQPGNLPDVMNALSPGKGSVISRGCGRSYGDESTNKNGNVIDMTAFDSIEHFDRETSIIVCGAGVTMSQLTNTYLADGIVPPVCPGTGFVTVAGAVANDVHGKNHDRHGSFGDHVQWLDLLLPSGELRRVTHEQYPELMRATIGGAGLTGVIVRVAFTMLNIGTNAVKLREQRINNLEQFMEALRTSTSESTYSVGWIDAIARGSKLGRGILLTAEAADSFKPVRKRLSINIPFNLPAGMLNRYTAGLFNTLYYRRIGRERTQFVDFERFVFPLDALLNWNRLYGSRGMYQFQCVIPLDRATTAIHELMTMAAASGAGSPLAVLKMLSGNGHGYLSFPMQGFTLALDFPRTSSSLALIQRMYDVTLSNGGRVYLAKDACLQAEQFKQMYPDADKMIKVLDEIDPDRIMQSDMTRRLCLHTS